MVDPNRVARFASWLRVCPGRSLSPRQGRSDVAGGRQPQLLGVDRREHDGPPGGVAAPATIGVPGQVLGDQEHRGDLLPGHLDPSALPRADPVDAAIAGGRLACQDALGAHLRL
jgi:hypothetical protein